MDKEQLVPHQDKNMAVAEEEEVEEEVEEVVEVIDSSQTSL